jgi:hypothetical protein
MSTFQIITLIFSGVFLLSGIIAVYVAMRIAIAEVKLEIKLVQKEIDTREIATLLETKQNREDHMRIMDKLDKLNDKLDDK